LLIAGVAVLAAAALAVALTALGGSSSGKAATSSTTAPSEHGGSRSKKRPHKPSPKPEPKAPLVSPAETSVAVLNATEAEGLAHRTASELQQNGYSQATALNGKPPGQDQVSVVEYASGHRAEAEAVARSAAVTRVQPLEAGVTALAGSANVVVIVGADKDKEASSP
jgi:LytR cell envelope-related transcriptional attenuator